MPVTAPDRRIHLRGRLGSLALLAVLAALLTAGPSPFSGHAVGSTPQPTSLNLTSGLDPSRDHSVPSAPFPPESNGPIVQWPMFLHDLGRSGANLGEVTIAPGNVSSLSHLWTYKTTGGVSSSMAVVNGTAYFGDWDGRLYAVNVANGSLEWKTPLPGSADYTDCNEMGIAATPAVWNGTVYVGGGNPSMYAVSARNGSILWSLDLANVSGSSSPWTAHKIWSSAAIYNGSLYVGMASGCDLPLVRGALFQIGLSSHQVEHTFWTLPKGQIGPGIWSSPTIDPVSNTVWVTTGNEGTSDTTYARSIVELNASNVSQVLGYAQRARAFQDWDFADGVTLFHSSGGTPMVVAVNKNGIAYAFNESDLWTNGSSPSAWTLTLTATGSDFYAPPAYDGHDLYFGNVNAVVNGSIHQGSVWCVNPDNGSVQWTQTVASSIYGGITYANGLVIAGLTGGGFAVLNATNGKFLYNGTSGDIWGEPVVLNGELLVTYGTLFSPTLGGAIEAFALPISGAAQASLAPGGPSTTYEFQGSVAGGIHPFNASWAFGDGATAKGISTVHSYAAAGTYEAALTVTDAAGRAFVVNLTVTADDPLQLGTAATINPVNLGGTTRLSTIVSGGAPPFNFSWTGLPPGSLPVNSSSPNLQIRPTIAGSYNVSVTVEGGMGQANRSNLTLWVDGPSNLTVIASTSSGAAPLNVSFRVQSQFPITTGAYSWRFSDGSMASTAAPFHVFRTVGEATAEVRVSYPGGSSAFASSKVDVEAPLVVNITSIRPSEVGAAAQVVASPLGGSGTYTWSWVGLPDGCSGVNSSILVCVPAVSAKFESSVWVSDSIGLIASANFTWAVAPELVVSAQVTSNASGSCQSPRATMIGVSANATGGIPPIEYEWTGPGNLVESGRNSSWNVSAPGRSIFTVTATDALGISVNSGVSVVSSLPSCAAPGLANSTDSILELGALGFAAVGVGIGAILVARRRRSG